MGAGLQLLITGLHAAGAITGAGLQLLLITGLHAAGAGCTGRGAGLQLLTTGLHAVGAITGAGARLQGLREVGLHPATGAIYGKAARGAATKPMPHGSPGTMQSSIGFEGAGRGTLSISLGMNLLTYDYACLIPQELVTWQFGLG